MARLDTDLIALMEPSFDRDVVGKAAGMTSYVGDPTSNLAPLFAGQFCHDTSNNDFYWSYGTAVTEWKKLNN